MKAFTYLSNPLAVVMHDYAGDAITGSNPMPVAIDTSVTLDANVTLGTIGIVGASGNRLVVNVDGSINTTGGGGAASSVTVTNFPATQPVSIASPVAVTGTFYQATQPVSGTFWQATQPVSGTVAVSNFPASQAVTGTFFQSTQPVSIASMPSTPVTGTFWQATQPVSGTFWQATQPVSFTMPALVAGAAIIGKVGIDQTTDGTTNGVHITNASLPVTGTFWQATQPVSGTVSVSNFPASQAVTGAFFQATQPVSLAATVVVQDTAAEASLATLVANSPVLGQALQLASVPVARASDNDTIYDRLNRRTAEIAAWAAQDQVFAVLASRANERASMFDRRGRYDRGSVR